MNVSVELMGPILEDEGMHTFEYLGGEYRPLEELISEIIDAIIKSGFVLEKFDEHPAWTNSNVSGEFTTVANKR